MKSPKELWETFWKWKHRKQLAERDAFCRWLENLGDIPANFSQKFGLKYEKHSHGWSSDLGFRHPKGGLGWVTISKSKGSEDSVQINLGWQVWDFDSVRGYRREEEGEIFSIKDVDLATKLEEGLRKVLSWEKNEEKGEWTPMYLKATKDPIEKIRKRCEEDEAGYPLPKI